MLKPPLGPQILLMHNTKVMGTKFKAKDKVSLHYVTAILATPPPKVKISPGGKRVKPLRRHCLQK